jgi:A/G-specific adenine glycosylase
VAELVLTEHGGEVPPSLTELQRPWRVGPYSARATMLFAFGEPLALVDTNFARIFERVFGYEMPTQPHKSDEVYQLLDALVPGTPGLCRSVNLALLDLADAICTPSDPDCAACPLVAGCHYAQTTGLQSK